MEKKCPDNASLPCLDSVLQTQIQIQSDRITFGKNALTMVLCLGSTCSALHNQGPFKPVCCWQGGRQRWKSSRGTRPTQHGTWPGIEIAQITHIVHIAYNTSESGISCSLV